KLNCTGTPWGSQFSPGKWPSGTFVGTPFASKATAPAGSDPLDGTPFDVAFKPACEIPPLISKCSLAQGVRGGSGTGLLSPTAPAPCVLIQEPLKSWGSNLASCFVAGRGGRSGALPCWARVGVRIKPKAAKIVPALATK